MDFHLVNMSGLDLVDSNTKLLLAYMWQLMRYHTLKQLSTLAFNGFTADESEVLAWANTQVSKLNVNIWIAHSLSFTLPCLPLFLRLRRPSLHLGSRPRLLHASPLLLIPTWQRAFSSCTC